MLCSDIQPPFLFLFTEEIPRLIYYSHFVPTIFSLLFGIFVLIKNKKKLIAKVLLLDYH